MDWSEARERWDALGYTQEWVSEQLTASPKLSTIMDGTSTTKLSRAAKDKKTVPAEVEQWLLGLSPKLGHKKSFEAWLAGKAAAQVVPPVQSNPTPVMQAQTAAPVSQAQPLPAQAPVVAGAPQPSAAAAQPASAPVAQAHPLPAQAAAPMAQTPPQSAQAPGPAAPTRGTPQQSAEGVSGKASVQGQPGKEIVIQTAKDAVCHHVTVNIVHENEPIWGVRALIVGLVLLLAGSLLWNVLRPTARSHHAKAPTRSQDDLSPDSDPPDEGTESDSDLDTSNPDDLDMPETPPKGQARPPCPSDQDVIAKGACWIGPIKGKSPPCGKGRYALQGECYAPDPERRKPRPNTEGMRDGGR